MKKSNKFPSRYPIDISKMAWFYEEKAGIRLVAELRVTTTGAGEQYLGTTHTLISMKKLCSVVDRYRKYKAKRRTRAST